jgi:subtilase family serine protease
MNLKRVIALVYAAGIFALAHAQVNPLDQPAHRPFQQQVTPDSSVPFGYTPEQVRLAYGFDQIASQGDGQVIGIVDAFDDPTVESDLGVFTNTFNLPPCTVANGCLTVVFASGTRPITNVGWSMETSLDVQWAHAIAPNAKILLVEAKNGTLGALLGAVPVAVKNGANIVSMSWGSASEFSLEVALDQFLFNNPSVTYLAASGDSGHNMFGYPAASPLVVAVGGTTLKLDATGNILSETAWFGSGGGISRFYPEPAYQNGFQNSGFRGIPDIAYNANPSTGVPVFDSQGGHWLQVGGTSASAPQWAALTAIANSMRVAKGKSSIGSSFHTAVYSNSTDLFDITKGLNGFCGALCMAGAGYDFVTGLGSPHTARSIVSALVSAP